VCLNGYPEQEYLLIGVFEARDGALVVDAEQDATAVGVREGHDLLGDAVGFRDPPLELEVVTFAEGDVAREFFDVQGSHPPI
jgi:hypothetical protein